MGNILLLLLGGAIFWFGADRLMDLNNADYIQTTMRTGNSFSRDANFMDYALCFPPIVLGGWLFIASIKNILSKNN